MGSGSGAVPGQTLKAGGARYGGGAGQVWDQYEARVRFRGVAAPVHIRVPFQSREN